ncbi:MAG: lysophospholipid acyltransferase family protein [Aristaeellaceae bacterium]
MAQTHSRSIRMLMFILRHVMPHELKNLENVHLSEDDPIVYLCNHGELYGPIAGMLYCPGYVRPWSISELCCDLPEATAYIKRYTLKKVNWVDSRKQRVARLLARGMLWLTHTIQSVPVFRHKPRQLMTTFRQSVEALQQGANLLIFPEDPDTVPGSPGYKSGRPPTLFRGFPMLAQVYYNRTGKRCRFMPVLCFKEGRTVSFGTEIVYDPDNDPIAERDRIVDETYHQMQALYDREEALIHA